jgi:hypothetical protein
MVPYHVPKCNGPLVPIVKRMPNTIMAPYKSFTANSDTVPKYLLPKIIEGQQIICLQCISQSKKTLARHVVINDHREVKLTALRRPRLARCSNKILLKVSAIVPSLRRSDSKVGDTACLVTFLCMYSWLQHCPYCLSPYTALRR